MEEFIAKARILIEALPFIRTFNKKIFVIKCGGAALVDPEQMRSIMRDVALLHFCGIQPIVVHGGGPDISEMCQRLSLPVQFHEGCRVTDSDTMDIVQMVLIGKTNKALVNALNHWGAKGVGISGLDAHCIQAEKASNSNTDLGFVGQISQLDLSLIHSLLKENLLPVIAPVGVDPTSGQAYNINADLVAEAIAGALKAEKLIVLTDVNGLYEDVNDPSTRISRISKTDLISLLQEKTIQGGMIPKLQSCLQALEKGIACVHMIDGKMPHSLLLEIFTDQGIGTLITQ